MEKFLIEIKDIDQNNKTIMAVINCPKKQLHSIVFDYKMSNKFINVLGELLFKEDVYNFDVEINELIQNYTIKLASAFTKYTIINADGKKKKYIFNDEDRKRIIFENFPTTICGEEGPKFHSLIFSGGFHSSYKEHYNEQQDLIDRDYLFCRSFSFKEKFNLNEPSFLEKQNIFLDKNLDYSQSLIKIKLEQFKDKILSKIRKEIILNGIEKEIERLLELKEKINNIIYNDISNKKSIIINNNNQIKFNIKDMNV